MRPVRCGGPLTWVSFLLVAVGLAGVAAAQDVDAEGGIEAEVPTGPVVWAEGARPTPGLWLVIDDGRGPRLVVARQSNAVAPLLQAAASQGLMLQLPSGGGEDDRQGLQAAWEREDPVARRLAGRYGSGELVLGSLSRSGAGWEAQWRVFDSLGETEAFSRSGDDALALLAAIGDGAARHFAQRSVELMSAGPPGEFEVLIEGLRSADDYIRLRAYLEGLAVVRSLQPVRADAGSLRVSLGLATGLERFEAMLEAGNVLAPVPSDGGIPRYRLR